jgi:hypothetical protein
LTQLAQMMSAKERAAWEKILRSDPKDTSKMKWNAFDKVCIHALLLRDRRLIWFGPRR